MIDYDRLHFAPKETQLKHLPDLLLLSKHFHLPLFLHSRTSESHIDLVQTLKSVSWGGDWPGGVVHSFTGTKAEADEWVCRPTSLDQPLGPVLESSLTTL
jgi:TatD DNase family protein